MVSRLLTWSLCQPWSSSCSSSPRLPHWYRHFVPRTLTPCKYYGRSSPTEYCLDFCRNSQPPDVDKAAFAGAPAPSGLSADERGAYEQLDFFYNHGLGYAQEMGNRPQTLYGLADSPVFLAAWILDHDLRSYKLIAKAFDGQPGGLTRDDVLDNITLFWLTNTDVSAAAIPHPRFSYRVSSITA